MKYFATILVLLGLAATAHAQITITSSDYLNGFNNAASSTSFKATDPAQFASLVGTSGAAQTWDFTGKTYTQESATAGLTIFAYPGGAPLASDAAFTTATHVVKIVDPTSNVIMYEYLKLNSGGFYVLGMVSDSLGNDKKLLTYTPAFQQVKFPLTYQTSWTSTSTVNLEGLPPGATMTQTLDAIVDGYGTLVVPGASGATLRLNEKITQTTSIAGFGFSNSSRLFEWIAMSHLSATVGTDSLYHPQSAGYSLGQGNSVSLSAEDPLSIRISANPASNEETQLFYTMSNEAPVQVALMDALGHNVRMLANGHAPAGQNIVPIDPRSLAAGTYFIRVTSPNMTEMRKLVIVR